MSGIESLFLFLLAVGALVLGLIGILFWAIKKWSSRGEPPPDNGGG